MANLKRKQIYLDEESDRALKRLALMTKISEAEHIRRAVKKYITKHKGKMAERTHFGNSSGCVISQTALPTALFTMTDIYKVGRLHLEWITPTIHQEAWDMFEDYADQVFSFVDCTSFVIARRAGVKEAFAFDQHFNTMGFTLIP